MNLGDVRRNKDSMPEILREVVRRIVQVAHPERIILFGSSARGDGNADSDIDVLVVKECVQRREVAGKIYRALIGVGRAVDVVVATPADIERYRNSPSMIIAPALDDGRVIYADQWRGAVDKGRAALEWARTVIAGGDATPVA